MPSQITIGLVPAHDAEATIADVVNLLRRSCDEVVVIDNASGDLTTLRALNAGAIVIAEPAIGKGHALRKGFHFCIENPCCGAIVTLDADGENDPSDIPRILSPILSQEFQVAFGARTRTHSHLIFGHGTTGELLEAISGIRLRDPMCGFRVYSREAMSRLLPSLTRPGFGIDLQIAIEVVRLRIKWCEVLVSGDNLRSKGGWSIEHVAAAMENLAAYEADGLFLPGSLSKVISWSGVDRNLLVLKSRGWEYHFRREGRLYVPGE